MVCIIVVRYLSEVNCAELLELRFSCTDKQLFPVKHGFVVVYINLTVLHNMLPNELSDFIVRIIL